MSFVSHHWLPLLVCMGWVADILLLRRRVDGGFRRGGYLGRSASTGTSPWTGTSTTNLTQAASSFYFPPGSHPEDGGQYGLRPVRPSRPTGPIGSGNVTVVLGGNGPTQPERAGYGDAA